MKNVLAIICVCALSAAAHAASPSPKGAKTTLHVEYTFISKGERLSTSRDQHNTWDVKRTVILDAEFVADEARAFGVMHDKDAAQAQNIAALKSKTEGAMAKAQPTMNDMMKIVQECGGADSQASQDCIQKKVSSYGNAMSDAQLGRMKSAGADVAEINRMTTGSRFQLWKMTSQSGTYSVAENVSHQVFEMTCTATKICRRDTKISGTGPVPMPPGGRSIAGAAMFEVDTQMSNVVVQFPVPLAVLETTQNVTTTIPGDTTAGQTRTVLKPFYLQASQAITLPLPQDLGSVSGRKTFPVQGLDHEGGEIAVTWRFSRPR